MSTNYFGGEEDDDLKPVDPIVIRPTLNVNELPAAKRVHDPAPRPRPQPLDSAVPAAEWIPGEKKGKGKKNVSKGEGAQHLLSAFSFSMKALSVLIILGVLAGIGYFVYWIVSQYGI